MAKPNIHQCQAFVLQREPTCDQAFAVTIEYHLNHQTLTQHTEVDKHTTTFSSDGYKQLGASRYMHCLMGSLQQQSAHEITV